MSPNIKAQTYKFNNHKYRFKIMKIKNKWVQIYR